MERRLYGLLGVRQDERASGILHAFHDLDRHLHPERGGRRGTPQYRRTVQAFAVLGDSGERIRYDASEESDAPGAPVSSASGTLWLSMKDDFDVTDTERQRVDSTIRANFADDSLPKSGRVESLELHVAAPLGIHNPTVELGVPVYHPCAACHGSGHIYSEPCATCDATGLRPAEEWLELYPAETEFTEVSLMELGIRNLHLRLQVTAI